MRKICLFVFLCIMSAACKQAEPYKNIKLENTLLWEISGNGLTSSSYLFGTNHYIGGRFADSLPVIDEKFKTCSAVAGEILIDTAELSKPNPDWFLDHSTLSSIFTPSEFSSMAQALKQYAKLDITKYNGFKPKCVEILLTGSIIPKTISRNNPSLDEYFQKKAKANGDKIIGLETPGFQNNLIFNHPINIQKKHLLFVMANMELAHKNFNTLFKLYNLKDINNAGKLMLTDKEYSQEEKDQYVRDRDAKWLSELPAIIKQQPTFIAVGWAHLLWDCGLINQLRLKGYTVKPVKI